MIVGRHYFANLFFLQRVTEVLKWQIKSKARGEEKPYLYIYTLSSDLNELLGFQ